MSYPNVREEELHAHPDDGTLRTVKGDDVFCDNPSCDSAAVACVPVSCNSPHDETRCYCAACFSSYVVGVQHGRFHEASVGKAPSRGDYLTPPPAVR